MKIKTKKVLISASVVVIIIGLLYKFNRKPTVVKVTEPLPSPETPEVISQDTPAGLNFMRMADRLYDAFDGYGTKNSVVTDVFSQLKNDADFDALKQAYGIRTVSSGDFNFFVKDFKGDLQQTIHDEMTDDQINKLNQIISSNGISRKI